MAVIFLTSLLTVVSGVIVYVITEVIKELVIIPLRKYKELKQKVAYSLTYYACFISNPLDISKGKNIDGKDNYIEYSNKIRQLAAELSGYIETISWFHIGIPAKKYLYEAYFDLIGLSNSFFIYDEKTDASIYKENEKLVQNIKNNLKIYVRR